MPTNFDDKLIIAISSRALLNLDESHAVNESCGESDTRSSWQQVMYPMGWRMKRLTQSSLSRHQSEKSRSKSLGQRAPVHSILAKSLTS